MAQLPETIGQPEARLADTGFYREKSVEPCEDAGVTPCLAPARQKHNPPLSERFGEDPAPLEAGASAIARMQHRMTAGDGKALYALRKCTVETVIGIIKHVLGFRAFSPRGLELAGAERSLVCSAWNLKRMHKMMWKMG